MIKVNPQPEPVDFNVKVRQKGIRHLEEKGIDLDKPLPEGVKISPYWRDCMDELYQAYSGICGYLAVHFERTTGGATVEHFAAKSRRVDLAYEWSNYRLASSIINSRKNDYEDVLDPFEIENGWFHVELVSGRIFPAPGLPENVFQKVDDTIKRLKLDDRSNREMRARHYYEYIQGEYTESFLMKRSPLVWAEACRQDMLL
ncbi:hypothetical protein [Endozoicomonas sp. 4G]|uniref:hypothetical protein n=1 Tax=Endozoicomonas sp. 4G TaxID=2872754 RepID=UPI0020786513|nr:hypothetical protein [Endozoicomonas sp. 4G]